MTADYNAAVDLLDTAVRTGDLPALNEAVSRLRSLSEGGDAIVLSSLGVALHQRYLRAGDLDDLHASVVAHRHAVRQAGPEHRVAASVNLANMLRIRFDASGDPADLDEAVELNRQVADDDGLSPRARVVLLTNLGISLLTRFQIGGTDITEAVDACRRAVDAMPPDFPDRSAVLANLAGALQARYERTGTRADLDEAIDAGRAAASGPASAVHRPSILSNLCGALQIRFELTGDGVDLDEALATGRSAIESTPEGDPGLPGRFANLATVCLTRFDRAGDLGDLDVAIALAGEAVMHTTADDPGRGGRLSNLGAALRVRADRLGEAADLDRAAEVCAEAVRLTPPGHPRRATYSNNLGNVRRARFHRDRRPVDAEEAIEAYEQAVAACSADDPDLTAYLANLGGTRFDLFEVVGGDELRAAAIAAFRQATGVEAARPRLRVQAATAWGRVAADAGDWPDALAGLEQALHLLGRVAPREIGREDQERELSRHMMIAGDAAACALRLDAPGRALTLLEQGRGLLLAQAMDARTELTDLREYAGHPADLHEHAADLAERAEPADLCEHAADLADRYEEICRMLDAPTESSPVEAGVARRRHAAELDRVVDGIRRLPGFDRFLLPPTEAELVALADRGLIVVVNVSSLGSHALVLTPEGITPVPLPLCTPEAVAAQVSRDDLHAVLDWLWRAVAEPVLGAVGAPAPVRIFWVATGLLTLLPLHAAQPIGGGTGLLDLAVSTSVPTLRALAHGRSRPVAPVGSALAIQAPEAPGQVPLPAVARELRMVRERLPVPLVTVDGRGPEVLRELPAHGWVHIACHVVGDDVVPSRSALMVHDEAGRPVTVADVSRLRLRNAELAYLSACGTSQTAATLADEAIHLTSAFQLAGYRHVIGTLWPISDRVAVKVAEVFYTEVTTGDVLDADRAATALHQAVLSVRRQRPGQPTAWAGYVHSGCV